MAEHLDEARSRWTTVVHSGDADAYAKLVTENVVWVPPDGQPIRGRSAFRSWVEPFLAGFTYQFTVQTEQVVIRGDSAIERGRFVSELTSNSTDARGQHAGTYVLMWQRCDDGEWRIDRYFDTTPG